MILNGWNEIAEHLRSGVESVQRLGSLGLPVRRANRDDPLAVIVFSDELDEWLKADSIAESSPLQTQKVSSGAFKRRVLIADDDEAYLVTTATALMNEGYEVRTARDGFETLAAMRVSLPEVLISDLRMPNMSRI
jgi:CheY-like chemotaxis protein